MPAVKPFDVTFVGEPETPGWTLALQGEDCIATVLAGEVRMRWRAPVRGVFHVRGPALRDVALAGHVHRTELIWNGPFGSCAFPSDGLRAADGTWTVDLAKTKLGSVRGSVAIEGLPAAARGLVARLRSLRGDWAVVPVSGGRSFEMRTCPGRYHCQLIDVATGLSLGESVGVVVRAGEKVDCRIEAQVGTLRVIPRSSGARARHGWRVFTLQSSSDLDHVADLTDVVEPFELVVPAGEFEYWAESWILSCADVFTAPERSSGSVTVGVGKSVDILLPKLEAEGGR